MLENELSPIEEAMNQFISTQSNLEAIHSKVEAFNKDIETSEKGH